ncbi:MAG: hypothetical protein WDN44_09340 [Sphingomonas sp.]
MSPIGAAGDLRQFLRYRSRKDLILILPALALTGMIVYGFIDEYKIQPEYHPNIIYVQSWPLDRTDAEIVAQQKIDQVRRHKEEAEFAKKQKAHQQEFKRLDDALKKYGI